MVLWSALLIVTLVASILIASVWLPNLFLKSRYTLGRTLDRGLKKTMEVNGQSIVYETSVRWRKYVQQYVLAERNGKKELACKVNENLTFISYDVVLFNNRDEVFKVLTVKDLIKNKGYTKPVELPMETSYVCITVNQADNQKFPPNVTGKVRGSNVAKYLGATTLCIVMELLCVKVCCANAFGGVFKDMFVLDQTNGIITAIIAVLLVLLNILISVIAIKIHGTKKIQVE